MWIKIVSGQTDRDMESVNARNKKTESELMRASEIVCCIRMYVLTTTEKKYGDTKRDRFKLSHICEPQLMIVC